MSEIQNGSVVVYVDSKGVRHNAIVTCVFKREFPERTEKPGLNVVYVSDDPKEGDSYGQQMKRETSVIHQSGQPAHGSYWTETQ